MKKKVLLLLLAFAAVLVLGLFFKDFISASIFDSHNVVQTSLNITIDAHPPDLIVRSPVSTSYSTNEINIEYSASDSGSGLNTVWYNIDGGNNITLEGDTVITVQKGKHVFYIYASDKVGLVNDSEFVTFSVK